MIRAVSYKNWCTETISPQSWSRLLLKSLTIIREQGLSLKELENPEDTLELPLEIITALNNALDELYGMQIEESALGTF